MTSPQRFPSDECRFCPFAGCEDCPHPGWHDPAGDTPPLWEEP